MHRTHQLATLIIDAAFITRGYTNWKDAKRKRRQALRDKKDLCQWEVVERSITLHATTKNVGEHTSSAHEEDKANNRKALKKIVANIRFLIGQGIPLRGDIDGNNSLTSHRFSTFELKTTRPFPHGWSRKPTSIPLGRCKTRC